MLPAQSNRFLVRAQILRAALKPAQILIDGDAVPILCSMEAIHYGNEALSAGGFVPDYNASFHVSRALFDTMPAIGTLLSWCLPGEPTYRADVRIDDITDSPSTPIVVLRCNNPNK